MVVIMLCGGTKKEQANGIKAVQKLWADYKARRKAEAKKGKGK